MATINQVRRELRELISTHQYKHVILVTSQVEEHVKNNGRGVIIIPKLPNYAMLFENIDGSFDSVITIDCSHVDFSGVTDMSYMFRDCCNLYSVNFGVRPIILDEVDMERMFEYCHSLNSIDLSMFHVNTAHVSYMVSVDETALENIWLPNTRRHLVRYPSSSLPASVANLYFGPDTHIEGSLSDWFDTEGDQITTTFHMGEGQFEQLDPKQYENLENATIVIT